MTCFPVTARITEQLALWAVSFVASVEQQCSNVAQQVQQWQQQWQNQCTTTTQNVCNSMPWPLSTLCNLVTSVVCTLVSVAVLVVVVVIQVVCIAVTVIVAVLVLVLLVIVLVLVWLACIVTFFCNVPMESSKPPDAGWLVDLGGATTPALSMNNDVEVLPDGELACQSMVNAIAQASQRIHLLNLEFDPAFHAVFSNGSPVTDLATALQDANVRGVAVRILVNQNVFANSVSKLQAFFTAPSTVGVRGFPMFPEMLHAKAMIVDGATAYMVGLPLDQGYWDTQEHLVFDARRGSGAGGNVPLLGDVGNGVGAKPAHTVSLRITGPGASDVDRTFVGMWNSLSAVDVVPPPAPVPSVSGGSQSVQIVRSAPNLGAAGIPGGEMGVLEAYLRAIDNAATFLYLEEQYFTSPVIGDALAAALKAKPGLQLIVLLNENPDMPTYKFYQNALLSRLSMFPSTQVGVFTPWRTAVGPPLMPQQTEIMQCYVEAKVAIADDGWAMIGSGNCDGASLGHTFEFLPAPATCFSANWRNVELNAVLYDGIAGQPRTGHVAQIRKQLWREHLGSAFLEDLEGPPAGGWLALWNSIAQANVAALNASQAMTDDSRILPYASALDTTGQLNQLGVDTSSLLVAPAVPT